MAQSKSLVAIEQQEPVTIEYVPAVAVTLEQAKDNFQRLHQVVAELMQRDIDYGVIPGTPKPTLYKAGAEKLLQFYGLGHRATCVDKIEDWEKGFFFYRYRVDVFKTRPDGLIIEVASCEGSANSKEKRYRNQDVYSIVNTLQKMAIKRALVGATLQGTGTSGIFTQDIEDIPELAETENSPRPVKSARRNGQKATEAQVKKIYAVLNELNVTEEEQEALKQQFGVESFADLSKISASKLIDALEKRKKRLQEQEQEETEIDLPNNFQEDEDQEELDFEQ